jgi:hypothetical protein
MGKKVNRVRVELDAGEINQLSDHEIKQSSVELMI